MLGGCAAQVSDKLTRRRDEISIEASFNLSHVLRRRTHRVSWRSSRTSVNSLQSKDWPRRNDLALSGCSHHVSTSMQNEYRRTLSWKMFMRHWVPSDATWSRLRHKQDSGQAPLRTKTQPLGLSSLDQHASSKVHLSNRRGGGCFVAHGPGFLGHIPHRCGHRLS